MCEGGSSQKEEDMHDLICRSMVAESSPETPPENYRYYHVTVVAEFSD